MDLIIHLWSWALLKFSEPQYPAAVAALLVSWFTDNKKTAIACCIIAFTLTPLVVWISSIVALFMGWDWDTTIPKAGGAGVGAIIGLVGVDSLQAAFRQLNLKTVIKAIADQIKRRKP